MNNKKMKFLLRVVIMISILFLGGFLFSKYNIDKENTDNKNLLSQNNIENDNINSSENLEQEAEVSKLTISAVGDFLIHAGIVESQYDESSDSYDFSYNFQHIKKYLSESDITIANLETTFSGEELGYSGYPSFNTPDEMADAMKDIGIDVVSNISNHSLDCGEYGFYRTRQILEERGFDIIGTRNSSEDSRYIIKEANGIKVGITAYGYVTEDYDGTLGLNCIPISNEVMPKMNIFNPYRLDSYLEQMKEQVDMMRNDGADVVIFYMHWGEEYELEPNETQIKIAEYLADAGVDIIFGDHPHTLQPFDIIKSSDGTRETKVFYSLGNFISCQRVESVENPYTEDGVIVNIEITKDSKSGQVTINNPTYIATWVKEDDIDGISKYQVIPIEDIDENYLEQWQKQRAGESFERTKAVLEQYTPIN